MKQKITDWLQSPRNYNEGVELYKQFGYNKMLKNTFSRGENTLNMSMLVYELAKLIGMDEKTANALPRLGKTEAKPVDGMYLVPTYETKAPDVDELLIMLAGQFNVSVDDLFGGNGPAMINEEQQTAIEKLTPAYNQLPELQKKVIRFREQYPFLKDSACPDELKILVADMFAAYDNYKEAYRLLSPENPDADNLALAKEVVENYLNNREMWRELDYYKENNELLGEHPLFAKIKLQREVEATADVDLAKKLGNARSNVTKTRKKLEKATEEKNETEIIKYGDLLQSWIEVEALYNAEIEKRKK